MVLDRLYDQSDDEDGAHWIPYATDRLGFI